MAGDHAADERAVPSRGFLAGLGRRSPWIAAATLAGALAGAAFIALAPPRYAALAVIEGAAPGLAGAPDDAAARARAPDVARAAVDSLRLLESPEFQGGDPLAGFLSRLTVAPGPGPRSVAIGFEARDPALAARAANTVADLAVGSLNEARARSVLAAEAWLEGKIKDDAARLADAEAKVDAERRAAPPPPAPDADGQGAAASALEAKLAAARAAEASAAGKAAELRRLAQEGRLADAPPALADDALRRLLDRRASVRAEIADASRTLLPLHPRMKDLAAELSAVDGQIRDAAERAARANEADSRRAAADAASLAADLAERSKAAAAAAAVPPPSALPGLEREAERAREELAADRRAAREEEARIEGEREAGAARVLARAETPRAPLFPKPAPVLLGGAAAGFLAGTILAALAALAAARRRSRLTPVAAASAAASVPPAPAPAAGPAASASASDVISAPEPAPEPVSSAMPGVLRERAPGAERLGTLDDVATLVATLRRLKPRGGLVVLVAGDDTGRALAIALEAARRFGGERATALVDLGATQDWLADILHRGEDEGPDIPGLSDLLAGRVGFGEVIRRDLSSALDVVLSGARPGEGGLDNALTAFAAAYGAVVLHASDWRSAWARAASARADAVAVVAPAARAAEARDAAAAALGDACPNVLAFAVRAPRAFRSAA